MAPAVATAAPAAKVDAGKAKADEATVLFKDGKFPQAAELFEQAFALNPEKLVRLRNAGRAYEEAGKLDYARLLFERYLQQAPDGPEKEEVRERLARLDKAIALRTRAADAAADPGRAVARPPTLPAGDDIAIAATATATVDDGPRWHAWGVAAAGAGAVAAALLWRSRVEEANRRVVIGEMDSKYAYPGGSAKHADDVAVIARNRVGAWATLGVGVAATAGGLLWAVWPRADARVAAAPIGPGGGPGFSLAATF